MQKKWSITCLLVAISSLAFAQNVGINTTSPDASAVLEVAATDKGMLVPRLTTTQRTTIASPATGLLVYDTTLGAFYFYNGAAWTGINSGTFSESDPKVGTLTTNYVPKWNGSTLANSTVYDNGTNVGIGTTSPNNKLDIQSSSSVTANVQSSGATAYLTAAAPAGSEIGLNFKTYSSGAGVDRWLFGKSNTAESGSNAGSNLFINRYNDAGTLLGQPFTINRSNGYVGIGVGVAQTQLDVAGTNAGTVSLLLRSGNTGASTSSSQIMFGYNGNTTYLHTIKTRHNSGAATGNAIDFYLWNYGVDGPSITGSKHVMTLQGNGC
ncbi:MAG: hypothetical protein RI894_154, partial [Bacteroidota bacterium]